MTAVMAIHRIFLNPGHGASNVRPGAFDPGAECFGMQEYEVVSQITDAVMTRYFSLQDGQGGAIGEITVAETPACSNVCVNRFHAASGHLGYVIRWLNSNRLPGDFVLSLHMNSSDNPEASGTEVYYSPHGPPRRQDQAMAVARAVSTTLGIPNRGPYRSDQSQHTHLGILDDTDAPALLIELGFISNRGD